MKIDPDTVSARDVMQAEPVTLTISTPVEKASEIFEDYGISGAPVVDEHGGLCGVLSASDLLPLTAPAESVPLAGPFLEKKEVSDWMTREILAVAPDATLGEVCDLMTRETVHRVFVTEGDRLLGIVAASDVVRLMARSSSAWSGDESG